jgi:thiaminase/transcriptional activator TenA
MSFSQELWKAIEGNGVYQKTLQHPFNEELKKGTLSLERFQFYVQQDSLYLTDFGRALALLAAKCHAPKDVDLFLDFSKGCFIVEQALHEDFFKQFKIAEPSLDKAPGCFMYTNYLLATCALDSLEVGMAALLPCFWMYNEIGHAIHKEAVSPNPYQAWIDTYAGEEFDEIVRKAIDFTDRIAEKASNSTRAQMKEAFVYAARMEYYFWDSAYRLEAFEPKPTRS